MTWDRSTAAEAIAGVLAALDATVSTFATPPQTLNPPAYVVGLPTDVARNSSTFDVDLVTIPVSAFGGLGEYDRVDDLVRVAAVALEADPTLAGVVKSCTVPHFNNWRTVAIGGAELLANDLVLEIRM
jgi:hypothetical protein